MLTQWSVRTDYVRLLGIHSNHHLEKYHSFDITGILLITIYTSILVCALHVIPTLTKLLDVSQSLKLWRVNYLYHQWVEFYMSMDGVIEYLKYPIAEEHEEHNTGLLLGCICTKQ